jgi:CRISPR-associated endonuclease/helicase Cas3
MMPDDSPVIAHVRQIDGEIQALRNHLRETASLCGLFASTIGLPLCGKLLGLLHDLGKYSAAFQLYIRDVTGSNGKEAKLAAEKQKGTIDHATSGAQHVWDAYTSKRIPCALAQMLSVVIMSHHSRSGMRDFIDLSGKSPFLKRLQWGNNQTHKSESLGKADTIILTEINEILQSPALVEEYQSTINRIIKATTEAIPRHNAFVLLTRFLFSCLLDADRISTIDFENPKASAFRTFRKTPDWNTILDSFEAHISTFKPDTEVNQIRCQISEECRAAATRAYA